MSKTSPTQRALAECKRRGYEAQVVERWNWHAKKRVDLFGCIDIVAVATPVDWEAEFAKSPIGMSSATRARMESRPMHVGIIGIQVTSGTNHAARIAKIKAEPRMAAWAKAGGLIWVWSYALRGGRGRRKTYQLRETEVTL